MYLEHDKRRSGLPRKKSKSPPVPALTFPSVCSLPGAAQLCFETCAAKSSVYFALFKGSACACGDDEGFLDEVAGKDELDIVNRGDRNEIAVARGQAVSMAQDEILSAFGDVEPGRV